MFQFSIVIIATVLIAHSANAILDGDLAEIADYPFAASILNQNIHRCGGSIIDARYILTAASCLREYNATNLTVRAGSSFYAEGGQVVEVASINLHPLFDDPEEMNNIAILELSTPLVLNENVAVIPLDLTGNVTVVGNGTILGWGIVIREESGWVKPYKPSPQLRSSAQPLVGPWVCDNTFVLGWDESRMFCAGLYRKDNCVGDAGNPFIFGGFLLGVAAETLLQCGQFPTAYVDVASYADFINEFIGV